MVRSRVFKLCLTFNLWYVLYVVLGLYPSGVLPASETFIFSLHISGVLFSAMLLLGTN